jgi:hypothetical protein
MIDDMLNRTRNHHTILGELALRPIIEQHASTALLNLPLSGKEILSKGADKIYHHNNSFWEDLNMDKLKRTDLNIILNGFYIFDWFPRSPGLYYTPGGRRARNDAERKILSIEEGVIVYNPDGKTSMLNGGIGNIKLKPIEIGKKPHFFLSASSNGWCDEGLPIALPAELYDQVIDEIVTRGVVQRDVIGKLNYMPQSLSVVYSHYSEVPKMYLQVYELRHTDGHRSRNMEELRVRVAVSFTSEFREKRNIYATYTTFDPSLQGSFKESIQWMEEEYVQRKFNGRIITDFDQTCSHFSDAPFSLGKVMDLSLTGKELHSMGVYFNFRDILVNQEKIGLQINHLTINHTVETKYEFNGPVYGSVGDNAQTTNYIQQNDGPSTLDLHALLKELFMLKTAAGEEMKGQEQEKGLQVIEIAESEIKKGNGNKAIQGLVNAGKWTFDLATKVGASLIAAILKEQLHI